jgi:hypothetical protein
MSTGKANAILLRSLLFKLACDTEMHFCYRCGAQIMTVAEMSIEHKTPWQDSDDPVELFFDLDNIGFSHRACNYRAARRPNQRFFSKDQEHVHYRPIDAARKRAKYTAEDRRRKYQTTGH